MKASAYLINTSRGPIVDESALIQAIQGQRIAGAGVDVFDLEPLPENHPMRQEDAIILTGHTGYSTEAAFDLMYSQALEDVRAWLEGSPLRVLNAD